MLLTTIHACGRDAQSQRAVGEKNTATNQVSRVLDNSPGEDKSKLYEMSFERIPVCWFELQTCFVPDPKPEALGELSYLSTGQSPTSTHILPLMVSPKLHY